MAEADLQAVFERDPACKGYVQPFLFFKGFLALQTHRVAHWLWHAGPRDPGLLSAEPDVASSSRSTSIRPPAIGRGVFIDHGTGIVIGETAVIGDDVSMLQGVTLGGTGAERGDRHPKIGKGVLLGAGAKVLGNITIGDYAKIASGSVVLKPVPAGCTAAGVPARLVNCPTCDEPAATHGPHPGRGGLRLRDLRLAPARANAARFAPISTQGARRRGRKRHRSASKAHLKRTFGNPHIAADGRGRSRRIPPRSSSKGEFIGVVYEDEDEDGSFMFEMAILAEDLDV